VVAAALGRRGIDGDDVEMLAACLAPRRRARSHDVRSSTLVPPLSAREREVLRRLACGESNAEIATVLDLSPHTVRTHVQNLLAKLGVHNRAAAVAVGFRHALL
jgi:DNA-binding NarL/FixJ family response regulator